MPRKRKERGRPTEHPLPPRIDATPEEIAEAFFRFPTNGSVKPREDYRCSDCGESVHYPDVLDRAGRCDPCAQSVPS